MWMLFARRGLMNTWCASAVLEERPENVKQWTEDFFTQIDLRDRVDKST
jgi:hypothetical protein